MKSYVANIDARDIATTSFTIRKLAHWIKQQITHKFKSCKLQQKICSESKRHSEKRQRSLETSINRKIALNFPTAARCIGQYAGLRRVGSGFDAVLGFEFMHFPMSISG